MVSKRVFRKVSEFEIEAWATKMKSSKIETFLPAWPFLSNTHLISISSCILLVIFWNNYSNQQNIINSNQQIKSENKQAIE